MSKLVVTVEYDNGNVWVGVVSGVWYSKGKNKVGIAEKGETIQTINFLEASVMVEEGSRTLKEWLSPKEQKKRQILQEKIKFLDAQWGVQRESTHGD